MTDILDPLGLKIVKKLSRIRWSVWHDAISILFDGYSHIKSALFEVAENFEQKIETRATAKGLFNKINKLEFTVLRCFWKTILECFNKNQLKLERSDIILSNTCEVYSSFKEYIMSKRGTSDAFGKKSIS